MTRLLGAIGRWTWGSAPDPGIFEAWAPVFQGELKRPRYVAAAGRVPWTHRRSGYPSSGCVPAAPDSVSPDQAMVPATSRRE